MARSFSPAEAYRDSDPRYQLLPFRFLRLDDKQEVLVNEVGEFVVGPIGTARTLITKTLPSGSDLYSTFKARQFLTDGSSSQLIDLLATKYRTKHSFIDGFTKLHIFVVTLRCDHSCQYCQVSRQTADKSAFDMNPATAAKAVDLMMESPAKEITLELQGGEPLLAFDVIRLVVGLAEAKAKALKKDLRIVVTTNLANVTNDILLYLKEHHIRVSTSLDGPAAIHNANRPRPENNSYELTTENIAKARRILGNDQVAALMTTTHVSLEHVEDIIDEYVRQEFHSIFLRPISPYGFAVRTKRKTGYEIDAFLKFYKTGLAHILNLNRQGYDLAEVYAKILLTKILTPYGTGYVDLQSPAGAGINVLVYNYDGDVYATDEARMLAEMGDFTFRLGNVHTHTHKDIFTDDPFLNVAAASCNQSLPGCSDCALQPYCGLDPVYNHSTQHDMFGHRPSSDFCKRNMEVIKHLFQLITSGDKEVMRIFLAWIQNVGLADINKMAPSC